MLARSLDASLFAQRTRQQFSIPGASMIRRQFVALSGISVLLIISCRDTPTRITTPDARVGAGAQHQQIAAAISVSPSSASIEVGGTVQLTATPAKSKYTWRSSNPSAATVDAQGLVTGVAAGTATITASSSGSSGTAEITVTSPAPPEPVPGPPEGSVLLLAAGDIAMCSNEFDEATAKILDANPTGTVAPLGDNVYQSGSAKEYANCYAPNWGRHLGRTRPAPGNHDYKTRNAAGYFQYFGSAAGDPSKGYYSYDVRANNTVAAWHIVVLNSNIARDNASAQIQWLRADLQANAGTACTIAYWHHPRFSSGSHGNDATQAAFWETLYAYGADIVLNGHDHDYERFSPQTPNGLADATNGIREFVAGTGGAYLYQLGTLKPNSEVWDGSANGVLKLTLSPGGYSWEFVPIAGRTFTDSGSSQCH
jgi:Big-like domain-containing protein/calcineurin-like phosphoesterase family protein